MKIIKPLRGRHTCTLLNTSIRMPYTHLSPPLPACKAVVTLL
jgi:hypothetical protein